MFTPVQLPNVTDIVYDMLRKQILSGGLAPGAQLNLSELETQLDVSRTPLKSALARLQVEGLVEVHPRRGTYITQFSARDIEECYEMRIALEAQSLRRLFEPQNQTRLDEITHLLEAMDGYFEDKATWLDQLLEYMDRDRRLHHLLVELSGNQRMIQAYEQANIQGYIAIMGSKFHHEDTMKTQAEHRTILNAIKAKDQTAVLAAAREHLEQARIRAIERLA